MSDLAGGCLCGAVRYCLAAPPLFMLACHCRDCQFVSGGAEANVMILPASAVSLSGALATYDTNGSSGARVWRAFCPVCGTPVSAGSRATPEFIAIRAGTLDDPSRFARQAHLWTDSAPPWHMREPGLPAFGREPPRPG